jgi:hypothetical protein
MIQTKIKVSIQGLRSSARETNVAENCDMIERIVAAEAREREAVITLVAQPSSRVIVHPTMPQCHNAMADLHKQAIEGYAEILE